MGTSIIEKNLPKNSFLRKNMITTITSIFPPTTAAATTAFHSGLSPLESGWIGWMPYFKEYDSMIELFTGKDFYTREKIIDSVSQTNLAYETIYDKIAKKNSNINYVKLFPSFVPGGAKTFNELCDNIMKFCSNDTKNIISAYWNEPDHTIHLNGVNGSETKKVIKDLNTNLEKLSKKLKDTLIIISADHGAVDLREIYFNEIPEIVECLEKTPSIESRFVSFFLKKDKIDDFIKIINRRFPNEFIIFTHDEFINSNLLGMGKKHKRIDDYIGDNILISKGTINIRYSINGEKDKLHLADHGGITSEEMNVPVIFISNK